MPATVKGFELFSFENFKQPLTVAFSSSIQKQSYNFVKDIITEVKRLYFFPGDPTKLARIYMKKAQGRLIAAELSFDFQAVSLSKYPVRQYRITKKKRILKVTRGAGKGNRFTRTIAPDKTEFDIVTLVAVKRAGGFKVSQGKLGFKGWLHTGRKSGEIGVTGLTNTFSSRIFERSQQPTWDFEGNRLPIHQLYGPSFTNILEYPDMQAFFDRSLVLDNILTELTNKLEL